MKKFIKFVVGLAVLVVLLVFVAVTVVGVFWLGPLAKKLVEEEGPKALGAEVRVEGVSIQVLRGAVLVDGLFIGNPEGFSQPSALQVGSFRMELPIRSLRDDTIVIDEILIDKPEVTYEKARGTDNLKELQNHIAAYTEKVAGPGKAGEAGDQKPAKKVVIRKLMVTNGVVHAKLGKLPVITLPLPTIERRNIGGDGQGGTSIGAAAQEVFGSLTQGAGQSVANSGDVISEAASKALGTGKDVGDKAKDAVKDLGELFRKK